MSQSLKTGSVSVGVRRRVFDRATQNQDALDDGAEIIVFPLNGEREAKLRMELKQVPAGGYRASCFLELEGRTRTLSIAHKGSPVDAIGLAGRNSVLALSRLNVMGLLDNADDLRDWWFTERGRV